jgi:N-methylhydantoinase A
MSATEVAAGVVAVVDAHMERAIRAVSVEEGADPREATLVAFGGAGGLHAGTLARRLEMARVAVPPYAGVFSALGLLLAAPRFDHARTVLGAVLEELPLHAGAVAAEAASDYRRVHGTVPGEVSVSVDMRYVGQSHEISVPVIAGEPPEAVVERFHRLHLERNGFARREDPVELVTFRAVAEGQARISWGDLPRLSEGPVPEPVRRAGEVEVWRRETLPAGARLAGPAIIEEQVGTILLGPGDLATVTEDGTIEVTW